MGILSVCHSRPGTDSRTGEDPESLSHLAFNPYRVVTDRRTDRIPIANTRSQQYLWRVKTVADRHCLAAYHNKHCWRAFRGYQHRWPWTPKIWVLSDFCYFRLRRTLRVNFRWNILEIDQNNLRTKLNWCWRASHEEISSDFLFTAVGVSTEYPIRYYCYCVLYCYT